MDVSSSSSIFDYVDVVEETLSVEKITSLASSPTSGAVAVFVGILWNMFSLIFLHCFCVLCVICH